MTYKDLKIVYEDNHILVVVKPYDVPVQADESGDPDMLTMLKQYLVEKYNKPGEAYLGLVHRLDRPTGGVMVFAKLRKRRPDFAKQSATAALKRDILQSLTVRPDTVRTSSRVISKSSRTPTPLRLFPRSRRAQNTPSLTTRFWQKRRTLVL